MVWYGMVWCVSQCGGVNVMWFDSNVKIDYHSSSYSIETFVDSVLYQDVRWSSHDATVVFVWSFSVYLAAALIETIFIFIAVDGKSVNSANNAL